MGGNLLILKAFLVLMDFLSKFKTDFWSYYLMDEHQLCAIRGVALAHSGEMFVVFR